MSPRYMDGPILCGSCGSGDGYEAGAESYSKEKNDVIGRDPGPKTYLREIPVYRIRQQSGTQGTKSQPIHVSREEIGGIGTGE